MKNSIIILDFGSQYTQLIARRIREMGVYAEVQPYFSDIDAIIVKRPKGIILSGGPASVYVKDAPTVAKRLLMMGIPVLGICYGMQLISHLFGGQVTRATKQEFGKATLHIDDLVNPLFAGIENDQLVWMSHADHIEAMPVDFMQIAHSNSSISAIMHKTKPIYCVQFHPEVTHTTIGTALLANFVFKIACCVQN